MLKEYQQALDKQTREQNEKFNNIEKNQKNFADSLNKKEKEMLKEYQQALDKQTREQNEKFNNIEKNFADSLNKVNETLQKLNSNMVDSKK